MQEKPETGKNKWLGLASSWKSGAKTGEISSNWKITNTSGERRKSRAGDEDNKKLYMPKRWQITSGSHGKRDKPLRTAAASGLKTKKQAASFWAR